MSLFRHQKSMNNENGRADDWVVTYADAVTLVLTFFIVIAAISEPIEDEILKIQEALAAAGFVDTDVQEEGGVKGKNKNALEADLENMIAQQDAHSDLSVALYDDGVLLELSSAAFFTRGSAEFTQGAVPLLEQTARLLREYMELDLEIQVEGHTDNSGEANSTFYASDWELSAARAAAVVRFLIERGELFPEKMKASGLAGTRPKVPNQMADGTAIVENQELNRRIEIKIEYLN
jgi:chemotaxis protein MotB